MSNYDWIERIPFVCPRHIRDARLSSDVAFAPIPLHYFSGDRLEASGATYPIIRGVPFLLPEASLQRAGSSGDRDAFYASHYKKRSRFEDLKSDYLAAERKFIHAFIHEKRINGLVLEVGCGTGIFADCSPGYLGMDFSSTSVFADGFEAFHRFVGDAQCIPLADHSVDMVFSYNTLEHVPRPDLSMLEIDRILKPGGSIVLHPAWNCSVLQTRLIPVRTYSQLSFRDKMLKAFQPLIKSTLFKSLCRIPYRFARLASARRKHSAPFRYKALVPYLGTDVFIPDCDAVASFDIVDAIIFFESRNYDCLSHPTLRSRLFSRHVPLIARKKVAHSTEMEPAA